MSMEQNKAVAEQLEVLRSDARQKLLASTLSSELPGIAHVADYLIACRQVLASGGDLAEEAAETAKSQSLDPALLARWIKELAIAEKDDDNPLHAFATIVATTLHVRPAHVDQVLLDFDGQSPVSSWYSDGVAFGLGPIRAGQVLLGGTAEQPIVSIATRSMASRDEVFKGLKESRGNENDAGELGGWNRGGRTIRTPKVTLKSGKLWYLVRGAGRAYARCMARSCISGVRTRTCNGAGSNTI
jgi:hypothetical protein